MVLKIRTFQANNYLNNFTNQLLENSRKKVQSLFIDKIRGADFADMQLVSKFSKRTPFLLCVIDMFGKHAWAAPLKGKKGTTITNTFQKILDKTNCKPRKIWVDEGSEFCKRSMKSWMKKNTREMYSTHNEGKSVAAKKITRTFKNKIYKFMTLISQNLYISKLDDIMKKYNNKYHKTFKIKLFTVHPSKYIDF